MQTAQEIARSIRKDLLDGSMRPVWLERFDQRTEAIEHPEKIWREPPVDIFTFTREFLDRNNFTEFHTDAMLAFAGERGHVWDELFKVIVLCWGQGSGKGYEVEIFSAYTMYRLLCLINPHRFFNIDPSSFFDILNLSFVGHDQAKEIFFERMKLVIRATKNPDTGRNWFAEQGVDLRDNGIGDIKEKIIRLPRCIRARCLPFTKVSWEGSNVLLGILDEPSRMVGSPPLNLKAHQVFAGMLDNSTGRFQRKSKVVTFAYPESHDEDLIMELTFGSQKFRPAGTVFTKTSGRHHKPDGDPDVYASIGATYEVNPRVKIEDYENRRKADPEGIATRIDCQPPHSRTGFYRTYPEKVRQTFKGIDPRYSAFTYEIVPIEHRVQVNGQLQARTYTGIRLLKAHGDDEYRVLGGDPGERSDIFALALARSHKMEHSVEAMVIRRGTIAEERPPGVLPGEPHRVVDRATNLSVQVLDRSVVVDGIAEIVPIRYSRTDPKTVRPVADTYPISFMSVVDFILQLKHHFPKLVAASFDRWNSSEMIEELIAKGRIDTQSLTFSAQEQYALYAQHRSLTYNDLIRCIPCPRAEKEFIDLQEVTPGRKVDHKPECGSKDVADAIVIACHLALELGICTDGTYYLT